MMFIGSKHCPHCGASATQPAPAQLSVMRCPRCKIDMSSVRIGAQTMRECEKCAGVWLDVAAFEKICADREQQSAVLGGASPAPSHELQPEQSIRYAPCPQCGQLMNRINFAKCSGVIVDVCKGHGTWFDAQELSAIVQFIRGGGLEVSRQREKHEIESQRQQLRMEEMMAANRARSRLYPSDQDRISGISATGDLLKFLLD
jgi:Zn-finger nucleic acid-binding protein